MRTQRFRAIALVVMMFGTLTMLSAGLSVQAAHSSGTVHVDDDCSGPGDGTEGNPFCTVQEGVSHAASGDTVDVAAGTYVESGQIVIDKDLTIVGAGTGNTILMTDSSTGSGGDARGWILVNPDVEFHLAHLTMDGAGHQVYQALRHRGHGSVDEMQFKNIKFGSYHGFGIAAFGTGPMDVFNSNFSEIGRIGVQFFGPGVNGSTATGNTYVGKGPGDWLDYGIEVGGGAEITARSNVISGNRGVASSDGSTSAGILVTTFFAPGTAAVIEDNTLFDNSTAIFVGFDSSDQSDVEAHQNNISGNSFGIRTTAPQVNATCNWWGDASGPYNEAENPDGLGDPVDDGVVFTPWLTGEAPNGNCNGPILNPETKDDCKNGGWEDYGFENQGECIRYVQTGQDSRE